METCPGVASGRCHYPPDREGLRSQESVIRRSQQMVSYSEKILDDTADNARAAALAGVKIAVSTGAHSTREFGLVRYGIDQARRASVLLPTSKHDLC